MDGVVASRGRPRTVTSKRTIAYSESQWQVHEWEVWSGSLVCRAAALRMPGALLVWLGAPSGAARLGAAALGVPLGEPLGVPRAGAAALLGAEPAAAEGLARRLAAALQRPVHVCCGAEFDRFTLPLLERALLAHLKTLPPDDFILEPVVRSSIK